MTSSGKIISLSAENVKRLTAVTIVPGPNGCVVIGGKNGAGKSSVLDSIQYGLGGAASLPEEPIRRGAENATVRIEIDDLVIVRRFTESGSTLKVSTRDGANYSSPQKLLDKLFSRLTFDPLQFVNMKPADQSATLRELVGIDTREIDQRREVLYEDRTAANRLVKDAEFQLNKHPLCSVADQGPAEKPDITAVMKEYDDGSAMIARVHEISLKLESFKRDVDQWRDRVKKTEDRIQQAGHDRVTYMEKLEARHRSEMEQIEARHARERDDARDELQRIGRRLSEELESCTDGLKNSESVYREQELLVPTERPDIGALTTRRADALKSVADWAAMDEVRKLRETLRRRVEEARELTDKIAACDSQKVAVLTSAKYPIDGLSVADTGGVLFDGIPFSQASRAQQIRTSVAIGIAMNPKLRVLLIRDGSLLDQDGMKLVAEMAAEHDAQIWIERVGDGDEQAIVIEEGHVRGVEVPEQPKVEEAAERAPKTRKKRDGAKGGEVAKEQSVESSVDQVPSLFASRDSSGGAE